VNIKGEYDGIKWLGFAVERPGRRRALVLKYSLAPGQWRAVTAPPEVTSEPKFRKWAMGELVDVRAIGEKPSKVRPGAKTVRECFDIWIEMRDRDPDVAPPTSRKNRSHFDAHVLPAWGDVPVAGLETRASIVELRAWVRDKLTPAMSPGTVHAVVSSFRLFCMCAKFENWAPLRTNPLDAPEVLDVLPAIPKKRDVVTLPVDVVQALLDCDKVEYRRAIRYVLGVCTGANDAELAGLRVDDVLDLTGPEPRLQILRGLPLTGRKGLDGRRARFELGKTKNEYRRRAIPLNACAVAALVDWLTDGWLHWVGRPPTARDPLLPNDRGEFSRPDFASYLRADLLAAKQPEADADGRPYTFAALRRTFSTTLARRKVPREFREQLMGQSSSNVNSEHYTGEVPDELFDAVRRLPFAWRRERPWMLPVARHEAHETARAAGAIPVVVARRILVTEPTVGFEPTTSALRKPCSTAELGRQGVEACALGGALVAVLGGGEEETGFFSANSNAAQSLTKGFQGAAADYDSGNHAVSSPPLAAIGGAEGAIRGSATKNRGPQNTRRPDIWALAFAAERLLMSRPVEAPEPRPATVTLHAPELPAERLKNGGGDGA